MSEHEQLLATLGNVTFTFDLLNDCTLTDAQKVEKARALIRELSVRLSAAEAALAAEKAQSDDLVGIIDAWCKKGEEMEAALAACEPMKQMLMQFVEEYGASSDPAADQRAAERHFIAAVNHLGRT